MSGQDAVRHLIEDIAGLEPCLRHLVDAERILRAIVTEDPLSTSTEGIDDGCFFCGADVEYRTGVEGERWGRYGATHWSDCTWVAGRRLLGIELEVWHTVSDQAHPE